MNTSAAESIADAPFAHDVPCVGCGYNLRGLAPGAACPECGSAAPTTDRADVLGAAPVPWRRRLHHGAAWLRLGVLLSPVLLWVGAVIAAWGLWRLTGVQPGRDEPAGDWRARVAARLGAGVWALMLVGLAAALPWAEPSLAGTWTLIDGFMIGAHAALVLGLLAAWHYLAILARRLPNPGLAARFEWLSTYWTAGVALVAGVALAANVVEWMDLGRSVPADWRFLLPMLATLSLIALAVWLWVATVRAVHGLYRALAALRGD